MSDHNEQLFKIPEIINFIKIILFLGAKRTPPEGWFHEPRSEAESALRKRNHAPAGCTHMHMHMHMQAQQITYAPEGA